MKFQPAIKTWYEEKLQSKVQREMNDAGGHPKMNNRRKTDCVARTLPSITGSIQFVIQIIQVTAVVVNGATVAVVRISVIVPNASTTPKILNGYSKNQLNLRDQYGGIHLIPN